MTVKELMKELKKCKPNATVFVGSSHANIDGPSIQHVNRDDSYVELVVHAEIKIY